MAREDDVFVVGNVDGVVKRANSECCCCPRREFLRDFVAVKVVVGEMKASTTTNDKANIIDNGDDPPPIPRDGVMCVSVRGCGVRNVNSSRRDIIRNMTVGRSPYHLYR